MGMRAGVNCCLGGSAAGQRSRDTFQGENASPEGQYYVNCCLTWRPPRAVILSKAAGRAEGSPSASPNHDHKRTFVYREILRLGRRPRSG